MPRIGERGAAVGALCPLCGFESGGAAGGAQEAKQGLFPTVNCENSLSIASGARLKTKEGSP